MGIPCITLRKNTEWIEMLTEGWNVLVGADKDKILTLVMADVRTTGDNTVYGYGDSAERIVRVVEMFRL